jgi:hypothetical protein
MSRLCPIFRQLGHDERGLNVVEFAIVSVPLFVILLAFLDIGYRIYLEVVVEGTLNKAVRRATVGGVSASAIDDYVKSQLVAFSKNAVITINKRSYYDFTRVGKPEKITQDTVPLGVYNIGDCFEDANHNGVWDSDSGSNGLGGSDDIVYYQVSVVFPRVVPLGKFLGFSAMETVTANTVLRNQPYGAQMAPAQVCT